MLLRYDEDFIEAAVLLCGDGGHRGVPTPQVERFHRERERLYSILDSDGRNTAFFQLHLRWFREWGLEKRLTDPLREFPLLPRSLKVLAFRKSRGTHDDGAELYVNELGDRRGVMSLRPESWRDEIEMAAFLRHEFSHLRDMVAPAFGYRPQLDLATPSLNQQRQARERYRLLWDISIDGRVSRGGWPTIVTREQRWLEFTVAFHCWPDLQQREVFDSLWTNPVPTHSALETLACAPIQSLASAGPAPGALCSLCGFSTFAWADEASLDDRMVAVIRSEFPQWSREQGACGRCVELYQA